jgi:hypothetical protein
MRRVLAMFGLLLFGLPISCLGDDSEVEELTILPCAPGDQQGCRCPDGARGVSECAGNGSGYGECTKCGHSCTLYPNCGGCLDCWETCVCQGGGNVAGCQETCLGTLGEGSSGGGSCTVDTCPDPSGVAATLVTKCCTDTNVCGLSISALGSGCVEGNQPGNPDPSCQPYTLPIGGIVLEGCCRPSGVCGVLDNLAGFGCTDPAAFGAPFQPGTCTP